MAPAAPVQVAKFWQPCRMLRARWPVVSCLRLRDGMPGNNCEYDPEHASCQKWSHNRSLAWRTAGSIRDRRPAAYWQLAAVSESIHALINCTPAASTNCSRAAACRWRRAAHPRDQHRTRASPGAMMRALAMPRSPACGADVAGVGLRERRVVSAGRGRPASARPADGTASNWCAGRPARAPSAVRPCRIGIRAAPADSRRPAGASMLIAFSVVIWFAVRPVAGR